MVQRGRRSHTPNRRRGDLSMQAMETLEKAPSVQETDLRIFTGNANPDLCRDICRYLEIPVAKALVSRFENGEIRVQIMDSVRGTDVYVVQPSTSPINDNLMELLLIIDALSRASARRITAVIPHYPYAKQEKKTAGREPISAKLVANLITTAGADRIITIDLHAPAIQGFFDIPVDNLYALAILEKYFKGKGLCDNDVVVVSPDAGGVARARVMAEHLSTDLAITFKRRTEPDRVDEIIEVVGDVKNRRVIIIDDMISTGRTLVAAANALLEKGAREIFAAATHPLLAGPCEELIEKSRIREIVVTYTVPVPASAQKGKFKVLSVAPLLGGAIRRNYFNMSVSRLFG